MEPKFFLCEHCGNLITMVRDKGVPVYCCGDKMMLLEPNSTNASGEKHLPVCEKNGTYVNVSFGSVEHPMMPEHRMEWAALQTSRGCQQKNLLPGDPPFVTFALSEEEEPIAAYVYCNLHGLWKTSVKS